MFQFIYNVCQSFFMSILYFVLTVVTGKLPKVSYYHFDYSSDGNEVYNICSDRFKKVNYPKNVSVECKQKIIEDFITYLSKDESFTTIASKNNYPIFDGENIIGNQGYYPVIQKSLTNYILTYEKDMY